VSDDLVRIERFDKLPDDWAKSLAAVPACTPVAERPLPWFIRWWPWVPVRYLVEQRAENARLRTLLADVVVNANRMRDNWAESDEAVRKQLWRGLHIAAERAEDEVYPL
jgi:hypothetical protein